MKPKRRRKLFVVLGSSACAAVVLLLSIPWWWPWLFRPVAKGFGLTFGEYERAGYAQFVLRDVRLTNGATRFAASRVDAVLPTVWLWRRARGDDDANYLRATNWHLALGTAGKKERKPPEPVCDQFLRVKETIAGIQKWIPRAELLDGKISVQGQGISIPQATWRGGRLVADVALPEIQQSALIRAKLDARAPYEISIHSASMQWESTVRLAGDSSGLDVQATGAWQTNRMDIAARFGPEGVLPERARVEAPAFAVPGRLVGLKQFEAVRGALSFQWESNRYALNLRAAARPLDSNLPPMEVAVRAAGDPAGLKLQEATISADEKRVANASGFLPIAFHAQRTRNWFEADTNAALALDLRVEPDAFLWDQLRSRLGVESRRPELQAHLAGTWRQPVGRIQLRAGELKFQRAHRDVPPIENLDIDLRLERQSARLDALTFSVANQPVRMTGEIPLPDDYWTKLPSKDRLPDWREATAQLRIEGAQVAALTPFLSSVLTPEGILDASVALKRGGQFDGEMRLRGVGTRPLESIGSIRNIEMISRFSGRQVDFQSAASIGGQGVFASGTADLSGGLWRRGEPLPPFHLHVTGTNVPLTRRVEAIVRADLNLSATNAPGQPPVISGTARLRNSFYLQELTALVPDGVRTPRRRPPYFSIEQKPFANWRLDAAVTGDKFLKVRTPLFQGEVSATARLQGTLQDPIAVGEAKIDSGTVRLPFASLPVSQGFVTLSSDNPYQPRLFVAAAARVFGYDVKMEITGPANAPVIQFTSTPPLTSEQILLMVMAGELPRTEFTLSSQQRAQRMALFLGRNVLTELGILGDANRLTIRSGETMSETGKPTYSIEYKLGEDWSIVGEYDRFNDYNLMLKWRVFPW